MWMILRITLFRLIPFSSFPISAFLLFCLMHRKILTLRSVTLHFFLFFNFLSQPSHNVLVPPNSRLQDLTGSVISGITRFTSYRLVKELNGATYGGKYLSLFGKTVRDKRKTREKREKIMKEEIDRN